MLRIINQLISGLGPRRRDTVMSLNSAQNTYTAHVRILCDSEVQEVTKLQECIKFSQPIIDIIVAVCSVPLLVMFGLLLQAQLEDLNSQQFTNITLPDDDQFRFRSDSTSGLFINIDKDTDSIEFTKTVEGKWTSAAGGGSSSADVISFEQKWNILGLCLALFCISVLLMGYIGQRLGICAWKKQQHVIYRYEERLQNQEGNELREINRQQFQHLFSDEQPPSYDLVVNCYDMPPPAYNTIKMEFHIPHTEKELLPGVHNKTINPS